MWKVRIKKKKKELLEKVRSYAITCNMLRNKYN